MGQNRNNGKVSTSKMYKQVIRAVNRYSRYQPEWQRDTTTNLTPIIQELEEKKKRNSRLVTENKNDEKQFHPKC